MRFTPFVLVVAFGSTVVIGATAQVVDPATRLNPNGNNAASGNFQEGVAMVAQGDLFAAVWAEHAGTPVDFKDIWIAVSNDSGDTWAPEVRVDMGDADNAADSEEPKLVVTDDGTLVCVWEDVRDAQLVGSGDEDLFWNRSTDGGATWMPISLPLNTATAGSNTGSDIDRHFLYADGNSVYCTWEEDSLSGVGGSEEIWFTMSADSGATWSTPVTLPSNPPPPASVDPISDVDDPKVAAAGQNLLVAFADDSAGDNDIWVARSTDGGVNWTLASVETDLAGTVTSPQLAMDGELAVIAWRDEDPSSLGLASAHMLVSIDGGATWGMETSVSLNVEAQAGAQVTAYGVALEVRGDDIYVAFADDHEDIAGGGAGGQAGAKGFVSVSNNQGASWNTDIALDPAIPRRNNRVKVIATASHAYIHMETGVDGSNRLTYCQSTDRGQSWSAPLWVPNSGPDVDTTNINDGVYFAASSTSNTACSAYWDNGPTGNNELYAACIVAGATGGGFCFGDGTAAPCPCGNEAPNAGGCANGTGMGAELLASGNPSSSNSTVVLSGAQLAINQPGLYFQGDNQVNGAQGVPFGDGLRCAGQNVVRLQVVPADGAGSSATSVDVADKGGASAGDVKHYQLWYRDPAGSSCGNDFNLSNGLSISWLP